MDNETLTDKLPGWAARLASRYISGSVCQFIVHGAVRDIIHYRDGAKDSFYRLSDFLQNVLFRVRDFVLMYDISKGLTFNTDEAATDFRRFLKATDIATGSAYADRIPTESSSALRLLERYIRIRIAEGKSVALVMDYADAIAPAREGYLSGSDRATLVALQRLAEDPKIIGADVTIVLVCENLAALHKDVVRNPFAEKIEIPLPDDGERLAFISAKAEKKIYDSHFSVPPDVFSRLTSGLGRIHLQQVISEAMAGNRKVGMEELMARKKELIEAECYGLLEFFEPKFGLDMVAGHNEAKQELRDTAKMLRKGRLDVLPMGYLIAGPVGTGKTYLATCFTGEIGIPCVKILNVRSQWQGVTEANVQKLLTMFKALGPLGVIVDEADAFLGDRDSSGDSGTSGRIFSQIASFMSNTDYRGKIIWFLLTCRPDLLPVDIKRQGRAEEHIALFHPKTSKDRNELFRVFVKKNKIRTGVKSIEEIYRQAGSPKLSGADIEAVIIRAMKISAVAGRKTVTEKDFGLAFEFFVPPVYAEEMEYQTLVAVMECTNKKLIPDEYQKMGRDKIVRRLAQLRHFVD